VPKILRSPLEISTVVSEPDFLAMQDAWNALADAAQPRSVFLRHEWFAAAWAWRRLEASLHVLVARRGGRVAGILPLIRANRSGRREFELLTVPDTQVADLLCAPDDAGDVADAFASELTSDASFWDTLHLDYLRPTGSCAQSLATALRRRGLRTVARDRGRNMYVDLAGTWNGYYDGRSRSLKKASNLAANRLHKQGDVRIESIGLRPYDESALRDALAATIDISARSWKRDTGNALDRPGPQAFIRTLSAKAHERGWLAIWLLFLAGKPMAMEYELVFEGDVHALRSDFDADCIATSPGSHLFRHLLEQLFGQGLVRYYMGPGDNAYKTRWSDQGEPLQRMIVYNRTLQGRFHWLREEKAKPVLRRIRDRLRRDDGTAAAGSNGAEGSVHVTQRSKGAEGDVAAE